MIKRTFRAITVALLLIVLPACLLTRLHETQKQVCGKETRLEATQDGLAIVFDQPLLNRDDVVAILGAKIDTTAPDGAALVYLAHNKNDEAQGFPISFQFSGSGQQYKLTKVNIGKRFQDFVPEELLHKIFDAGCSAKRKGLGIEVDISGVPVDKLPKPDVIKKMLGQPALTNGTTATYEYELNRTDAAEITFSYDKEMTKLTSAAIFFQRYRLVFDFTKGVATAALKSVSSALGLGFTR